MPTTYDEVPYPSFAFPATHPRVLAALAILLGLEPAPVQRCRLLELGCASGGNLLPMALTLPESRFVGIDSSGRQIADGNVTRNALGLRNVELHELDLAALDSSFGEFDYIVAHGLFSWVKEPLQEKILAIFRQHLAPEGVAYLSYNTYPGWHMLRGMREMMLYRTRGAREPALRVKQARSLLDFLVASVPGQEGALESISAAYRAFLKHEQVRLAATSESYVFHEMLEETNQPLYFHEMVERLERHGLQYLCEVDFGAALPSSFPPEVRAELLQMSDTVTEMEQYMDFVRNRSFRQSLLVHSEVAVSRSLRAERIGRLAVASRATPAEGSRDLETPAPEQFRCHDGSALTTDHPVSKAAMQHLTRVWPRLVPFGELLSEALAALGRDPSGESERVQHDAQLLQINLLKGFCSSDKLVELRSHPPEFAAVASARPVASPWARLQAASDTVVTNLRHERVELTETRRLLLRQLDGSRDRRELLRVLARALAEGVLVTAEGEQPLTPGAGAEERLQAQVEHDLDLLARAALLVA